MNRKLEVFLGTIILVIMLGFIGKGIFSISFSEEDLIAKIPKAIEAMDLEYLSDHIEIEGSSTPLTKEEIKEIASLLKDEGFGTGYHQGIYELRPDFNVYAKKSGREKLIFDRYVLVLKPYTLRLENNMPNAEVYIDDKKIGTIDKDSFTIEYPNIRPGKHRVKVVYEGEFSTLDNEEEIVFFKSGSNNIIDHNMLLDVNYATIYTNIPEATLYVNGKDTKIKPGNQYEFGPIPLDGSIEIQAKVEIDGEIYESKKYTIDASNYHSCFLDIDYESEEDIIPYVEDAIEGYLVNMVLAINYDDYSYVAPYIEKNSPLMDSQLKLIAHLNSKGTKEELLSYDIKDIYHVKDHIYEAIVKEEHRIFYESGEQKDVSNQWTYTLVWNGEQALLTNLK